jgi:hypothetical protein
MIRTGELVPLENPNSFEEAREAAASLSVSQLDEAARQAGLVSWLHTAGKYPLAVIADSAGQALRMPFPSPFSQELRTTEGYRDGV